MQPSAHFLGRETELQVLQQLLGQTLQGQGATVLIDGIAGIGKTALCHRLARLAHTAGLRALWGRCHEVAGAPVYWPWRQLMRELAGSATPAEVQRWLGSDAAGLSAVVPELGRSGPGLDTPALESAAARFALHDAFAHFWLRAARDQPLLLILDDLHWADSSSVKLLSFLAPDVRDHQLLIVATWRKGETGQGITLAETAAELARSPGFERMTLGGLSREETAEFLHQARLQLLALDELCTQAGMQGLAARVRALQVSLPRHTSANEADHLTTRELEVLRLLAIGRSNRDIGQALTISSNTVANHIRSILEKTFCANRTEAAAYASRRGWIRL